MMVPIVQNSRPTRTDTLPERYLNATWTLLPEVMMRLARISVFNHFHNDSMSHRYQLKSRAGCTCQVLRFNPNRDDSS